MAPAHALALALLAVDLALIATGAHPYPLRQLWHLVGFGMLYLAGWWLLAHRAAPERRLLWLAALSALCVPVAWSRAAPLPTIAQENSARDSGDLWSVALRSREQRIGRLQPVSGSLEGYEVRVRLAGPYAGPARLHAAVNGVELGPLAIPAQEEKDQVEASARIPEFVLSPAAALAAAPLLYLPARALHQRAMAHIVVWQDVPAPELRIVAQSAWGGAVAGRENSWFHDGTAWRPGVLEARSGTLVPGLWHVFLARGHVGR